MPNLRPGNGSWKRGHRASLLCSHADKHTHETKPVHSPAPSTGFRCARTCTARSVGSIRRPWQACCICMPIIIHTKQSQCTRQHQARGLGVHAPGNCSNGRNESGVYSLSPVALPVPQSRGSGGGEGTGVGERLVGGVGVRSEGGNMYESQPLGLCTRCTCTTGPGLSCSRGADACESKRPPAGGCARCACTVGPGLSCSRAADACESKRPSAGACARCACTVEPAASCSPLGDKVARPSAAGKVPA